jgi:hypothetical protein
MSSRKRGKSSRRRGQRGSKLFRRRATLGLAITALPIGLLFSVSRTSQGARLAEELNELRLEEQLLQDQLSYEIMRVDSLSSRSRITVAAAELGLREAADDEVLHLADTIEPVGSKDEAP